MMEDGKTGAGEYPGQLIQPMDGKAEAQELSPQLFALVKQHAEQNALRLEFPRWRYCKLPPSVREALKDLFPDPPHDCLRSGPWQRPFLTDPHGRLCTALWACAQNFAMVDMERKEKAAHYAAHKGKAGRKPQPGTEHAGAELGELLKSVGKVQAAFANLGPYAAEALRQHMQSTQMKRQPYLEPFFSYDYTRFFWLTLLLDLMDTVQAALEDNPATGQKGLLAQVGRGAKNKGLSRLVSDLAAISQSALDRIPTEAELTRLIHLLFDSGFYDCTSAIKTWHARAARSAASAPLSDP